MSGDVDPYAELFWRAKAYDMAARAPGPVRYPVLVGKSGPWELSPRAAPGAAGIALAARYARPRSIARSRGA